MPDALPDRSLSPKSLVLDLLSVAKDNALPVRTLVRAGELMGTAGSGVRVALTRLRSEGKVTLVRRGTYALSPAARKRNRQVLAWSEVLDSRRPWDGGWVGAVPATGARDERALASLGFARLAPTLFVRPDNLRGGLDGVRLQLDEVGLSQESLTFRLTDLDPVREARARGLWDVKALARAQRATATALRASARRVPSLGAEEALREMFLLGGQAIRQIVLDPRLPDELAPPAPLAALVEGMSRYDARGRHLWARHLELDLEDHLPVAPAAWAELREQLPTSSLQEAS